MRLIHHLRRRVRAAPEDQLRDRRKKSRALGEFWRGRTERREAILRSVDIEPPSIGLAKRAGEALAAVAGATIVDAVVMASASARGDVVYTSDVDDLAALQRRFVRLLGV